MVATKVTFYDIPRDHAFPLVAKLAGAAWERDKRLLVRCGDKDEAQALDDYLWTFREDAFLPHEVGDGVLKDPRAKVVLVTSDSKPIEADVLVQLAPADLAFATSFAHVIDLVDHADDARLTASRQRFRAWSDAGTRPELKTKV